MATRFANTVDLLALLSEKIHNRNLLYNLCLTNRAFNAIFSRQLYKCLRWDESNMEFLLDPEKLFLLVQSGQLAHTRVLIILNSAIQHVRARVIEQRLVPPEEKYHNRNCKLRILVYSQVNQIIVDIVKHARGLKSFAQRSAVSQECMDALSTCPDLQTLAIEFYLDCDAGYKRRSKDNYHPIRVFPHAVPKLSAFSGIQRLSLHSMWGDITIWKTQLLQVLLNSPHLKHIGLSISEATTIMYTRGHSPVPHIGNPCKRFFEELATHYAENKGQSLNLKTMRLGKGMSLPNLSATANSVNWNVLEEFHIDNSDKPFYSDDLADTFGSYFPPKLRILSFSERGPKSREFLPSLLDSAHISALGDEFGIISSADTDRSPHLLASTLGRVEDSNLVMAMFPLEKSRDGYDSIVPQLPVPPSAVC